MYSSNENPNRNDVAGVLEASDGEHKLDILVLVQMNLSICYFFKYLRKGCVGRIECKSIQIFLMWDIIFYAISLFLNFAHCLVK